MGEDDIVRINQLVAPYQLKAEMLPGIYRVCVLGDKRAYLPVIALIGPFPGHDVLSEISTKITNNFNIGGVTFQLAKAVSAE